MDARRNLRTMRIVGNIWTTRLIATIGFILIAQLLVQAVVTMRSSPRTSFLTAAAVASLSHGSNAASSNTTVDLNWYAPNATMINDLQTVINTTGVYGFIFNSSITPDNEYGVYNWCNMPHVRAREYPKAPAEFTLQYVEVIHRHHKRTVYAANSFPVESYGWDCYDEGLFYYGEPLPTGNTSSKTFWKGLVTDGNPFFPSGFIGSCQFPQITAGGLDDSWQHGKDLFGVYHDLLKFLPSNLDSSKITYRVTTNEITSQVAGMLINGMFGDSTSEENDPIPLLVESTLVDSLEPTYTCDVGTNLYNTIESTPTWDAHLTDSQFLYNILDNISGVSPTDSGFHVSWDHYYDNLSARQCHSKPLPCKLVDGVNSTTCVTQEDADTVFRLGNWEYSYIYRDSGPDALAAGVATYGVWISQLATHIRDRISGASSIIWRHNVAHDGSMSRLLSVLQVDVMVWPGMGSEVVFEVYSKGKAKSTNTADYFIRVLWKGQVMRSSNPGLGLLDMVPLDTVLAYFDGLVGVGASLIVGKCNGTIS